MDDERWQQIERLYHAALARSGAERAAFLAEVCAGDEVVRCEVQALLDTPPTADGVFARPAVAMAAPIAEDSDASILTGRRLGVYQLQERIGAGGMGEVYRARDRKLGRDVAIKILPRAFTDDPDRLARFAREARVLAALNHPNIAHVHGLEESDAGPALVMELVDGATLAERLAAGERFAMADTLSIASQLADALHAAHTRGIVHRDLKPANIKVTTAGLVKVLDFGLAKELTPNLLESDALTAPAGDSLTLLGTVVGTLAYMSPEQARGEPLDTRTDLFSLGAVLYEITTGRRAFPGENATLVVDAILHASPPSARGINSAVPVAFERIVMKLLEKDRRARYANAADLVEDVERVAGDTSPAAAGVTRRRRNAAAASVALAALLAAGGLWVFWPGTPAPTRPNTGGYEQVTFFADSATSPAFSADGKMLTFIQGKGQSPFFGPGQVYVKALPDGEPVQLTVDDRLKMAPVFSPDGSRILYTVVEPPGRWDTWTVPTLGGEPRLWLSNAASLTWSGDRRILFSEVLQGIHMRVVEASEARESVRSVYTPGHEQGMAHWSYPSPDRRSVAIVEMESGTWLPCRIVPFDGTTQERSVGTGQCTSAAWSPDGRWMYYSSNASGAFHIWRTPGAGGAPEQVTDGPTEEEGIAIAPDGRSLLTSIGSRQQTLWMHDDRGDRQISKEGDAFVPIAPASTVQPFSADGRRLFYLVRRGLRRIGAATDRGGNLWMTDLASGLSEALLPGFNILGYDISRDGTQIVFAALDERDNPHLWLSRLDGQLPPHQLTSIEADNPRFGSNGEVFFRVVDATSGRSFIYRIAGQRGDPRKAIETPILFFLGASPDGNWLTAVVPTTAGESQTVVAFSTATGEMVRVCSGCVADWTNNGNALVMTIASRDSSEMKTVVLANERGRMLPRLPLEGVKSEADLTGLAVVSVTSGRAFPLGTTNAYAFTRSTVQRNIFRVPIR